MRWLVRFNPSGYPKGRLLSSVRTTAKSVGADARNPKWTSYGALELDIFCPTDADFALFMAAIGPLVKTEFVTDLNRASEHLPDGAILTRARALFNAERYWECHEVLEGLWRQKQGDERIMLQGMILVCAAYVHHQKGNEKVALGVLARGVKQLGYSSPEYVGFDIPLLRAKAEEVIATGRFFAFRV